MKQLVLVPPSKTSVTVEITLPDTVPVTQTGGTPIDNKPPIVNAGNDQTITLPTNSTTLTGSGIDSDGNVVSFNWTQVIGPNTAMIAEPNRASTIIASLIQGTYVFRLAVTDDSGATSTDDIIIKVDPEQIPNQPPSVNAGQDLTITLPTNSVILDGTASDPDGTVVSALWTKVSGPAAIIANPNAIDTQATNLVKGTYVFQLEVTDNSGAKKADTMTVVVNDAIQPPATVFEGYGVDAVGGGNSSTVYHVTNLNASGSGSLAAGIGSNKTIVFDVSGTINARLYIQNLSFLTIDAYSNGKDITIASTQGDVLTVEDSHHIIIRGIRFKHVGTDGNDCLNATGTSHDVIFDHCSGSGAYDGTIDLAATAATGKNFTVQWCMMYDNRGSGNMLITTQLASVHHNLFIGNKGSVPDWEERNPYAHSNYSPKGSLTAPNFDFVNNVIQASGRYASGNGYGAVGNFKNNYYVSNKACLINLCADSTSCGTAFVSGNYNQPNACGGNTVTTEYQIPTKYKVTTTDAQTAARAVLQNVGTAVKTQREKDLINAIVIQ